MDDNWRTFENLRQRLDKLDLQLRAAQTTSEYIWMTMTWAVNTRISPVLSSCVQKMSAITYTVPLTETQSGREGRVGSRVQSTEQTAEKTVRTCQSELGVMQLSTRVSQLCLTSATSTERGNERRAEAPTHELHFKVLKTWYIPFRDPSAALQSDLSGNQICSCGIVETRGMTSSNHKLGQLPT